MHSGAGGGGGGYAKKIISLDDVTSVQVIVGAGGAAGVGIDVNGGPGGTSAFGNYCSATGGAGGGASQGTQLGTPAASGYGVGGDINLSSGVNWWGTPRGTTAPFTGSLAGKDGSLGTAGAAGYYGGGGGGGSYALSNAQQNGGPGGSGVVIVTEY